MQASRLTAIAACVVSAAGLSPAESGWSAAMPIASTQLQNLDVGIVAVLARRLVGDAAARTPSRAISSPARTRSSPSCPAPACAGRRRRARARPRPRPCRRGSCRRRDSPAPDASTDAGSSCPPACATCQMVSPGSASTSRPSSVKVIGVSDLRRRTLDVMITLRARRLSP